VEAQREIDPAFFGTARFLTSQGLGIGNSLWQVSADSRHPTYEGSAMAVEDAVAAMDDVTRVYIMLGMNDIQYYDTEDFINNYRTLIYLIRSKTPGVDICIQSITPGTAGRTSVPTNEDIFLYDLALAKLCAEYGYTYIDVASALRDDAGSLPETLCSDAGNLGLHLNESAVEIWIQYLRTHAGAEPD
jgi:lysophospholipase L1-like esterase